MLENDTNLIRELCDSYRIQLGFYNTLNETVQKILSRLILSRGDLSSLKADFAEKQRCIEQIQLERLKTQRQAKTWQETKALKGETREALELDIILGKIENTINKFLDGEDQLKKHLERILQKRV